MTIALAIIGGIVIILGAATRIPPAAAAFLRACIPLIAAFHDLREAIRRYCDDKASSEDPDEDPSQGLQAKPGKILPRPPQSRHPANDD